MRLALAGQLADLATFALAVALYSPAAVAAAEWNPLMSRALTGVGLAGIVALKLALLGVMLALASRLERRGPAYAVIAAIGLLGAAGNPAAL